MTEENVMGGGPMGDPRASAGFQLEMSGLSIPGIESGVQYVGLVAGQFEPLARIQDNWKTYSTGVEGIRNDASLSEDERLNRADGLHEAAQARHEQLVGELQAEIRDRRGRTERSLFGMPGVDSPIPNDGARSAAQNGFREALLSLAGADEARIREAVEMAGLTGDRHLLRAARVVAHRNGLDDVVEKSVLSYGDQHERERYVQSLAIPNDGNLGIITRTYAPARANLTELMPDLATQREAQQRERDREARRAQRRR